MRWAWLANAYVPRDGADGFVQCGIVRFGNGAQAVLWCNEPRILLQQHVGCPIVKEYMAVGVGEKCCNGSLLYDFSQGASEIMRLAVLLAIFQAQAQMREYVAECGQVIGGEVFLIFAAMNGKVINKFAAPCCNAAKAMQQFVRLH